MWTQEAKLHHNEFLLKGNRETGEIVELSKKNVNNGMTNFTPNSLFNKSYSECWQLLDSQTTAKEFMIAMRLSFKIKPYTGTIMPLNPNTPTYLLAETLDTDRRTVNTIIDKLITLGVIALFEVNDPLSNLESTINGFWVFNPYLAFNGKVVIQRVLDLFEDTNYAKLIKK